MLHPRPALMATRSTIQLALVSFPIACFTLTLLTDLAYYATSNLMWQNFSSWLLFAGLVGGGLSVIGWIVFQVLTPAKVIWSVAIVNIFTLIVAFFNALVHAGDGWTAIVPWGIALSVITLVLMFASGLLGRTTHRY